MGAEWIRLEDGAIARRDEIAGNLNIHGEPQPPRWFVNAPIVNEAIVGQAQRNVWLNMPERERPLDQLIARQPTPAEVEHLRAVARAQEVMARMARAVQPEIAEPPDFEVNEINAEDEGEDW